MMEIDLPFDGTFLSLAAYEGLLHYREVNSTAKVIEKAGAEMNSLKEEWGDIFNRYIKIELTGNDLTRIDLPKENSLKKVKKRMEELVLKNYESQVKEEIIKEIKEIDLRNFINESIIEADLNLERVENLYGYFEKVYNSSDNWIDNENEFLQRYAELNEGEKMIWLGKVKGEFEPLQKESKFNKFREKLVNKLLAKEGRSKAAFFKNVLPCYVPVYMRIGFPEQLLGRIFPNHYNRKRILKMALEKKKRGKKTAEEITYNDIIQLIQVIYNHMKEEKPKINNEIKGININFDHKNNTILISTQTLDRITAPQILKCDRYTGFSAFEENLFTKQYTLYISPDLAIIYMIGLMESLILRPTRECHYFLFFSPDEVSRLYLEKSPDIIRKYLLVKDKAIEILRKVYLKTQLSEVAVMELALNLELQNDMNKHNLDKVSFILFKLVHEGNTYKIYEQIPITLYRRMYFGDLIRRYFRNPDKFIKRLADLFNEKNKKPYYILWKALESINTKNKTIDADNAFRAMMYLYRFVILGDPQGYYQFIRELHNCYRKTENEAYKGILSRLWVS